WYSLCCLGKVQGHEDSAELLVFKLSRATLVPGEDAMTKQRLATALLAAVVACGGALTGVRAQEPAEDAPIPVEVRSVLRSFSRFSESPRLQDFNELIKGSKAYEGLFTLHEKDQHLYAEIKPQQLDQPFLAPMMIARGTASAGRPLNFGDEWILSFH